MHLTQAQCANQPVSGRAAELGTLRRSPQHPRAARRAAAFDYRRHRTARTAPEVGGREQAPATSPHSRAADRLQSHARMASVDTLPRIRAAVATARGANGRAVRVSARTTSARGGTRTHTPSRTAGFKRAASTSFATRACSASYATLNRATSGRRCGVYGVTGRSRMEASALQHAGAAGLHGRSPLLRLQSDERLSR